MFKIEKNVPISETGNGQLRIEITETLEAMEPGDSFVIHRGARQTASNCAAEMGCVVAIRAFGDSIRVWLTERTP